MFQKSSPHGKQLWSKHPPNNKNFHSTLSLFLIFPQGEVLYSLDPNTFQQQVIYPSFSSLMIPPTLNLFRKEEAQVEHGKHTSNAPQFTKINPCGNCSCIKKNPILPQMNLNILSMQKREKIHKTLIFFGQQYNIICHIIFTAEEKRTSTLYGQIDHHTCTKFEAKCELLLKVHVLLRQHRCKNKKRA